MSVRSISQSSSESQQHLLGPRSRKSTEEAIEEEFFRLALERSVVYKKCEDLSGQEYEDAFARAVEQSTRAADLARDESVYPTEDRYEEELRLALETSTRETQHVHVKGEEEGAEQTPKARSLERSVANELMKRALERSVADEQRRQDLREKEYEAALLFVMEQSAREVGVSSLTKDQCDEELRRALERSTRETRHDPAAEDAEERKLVARALARSNADEQHRRALRRALERSAEETSAFAATAAEEALAEGAPAAAPLEEGRRPCAAPPVYETCIGIAALLQEAQCQASQDEEATLTELRRPSLAEEEEE